MRYFVILCLILISLISFDTPQPARAVGITVDGTCTLTDAIIAANTDSPSGSCPAGSGVDVITLDVDVNLTSPDLSSSLLSTNQAGLPDITSEITIQAGVEETISGNSTNFRIFNVVGGNLTLNGIIVSGGAVNLAGGGIFVDSAGTLSLIGATVTGNTVSGGNARSYGGGIYNEGTIALISASIISDNHVHPNPVSGLGLRADGGGIYSGGTLITINNSSLITGNSATGGDSSDYVGGLGLGGGIRAINCGTIEDTTISNNQATGGDSPTSNAGTGSGGGMSCSLTGLIQNTIFSSNVASGGSNSVFGGGGHGGGLGGFGTISLHSVEFTNNIAQGGSGSSFGGDGLGGGLMLDSDEDVGFGLGALDMLTVSNNQAIGGDGSRPGDARGGGMFLGKLPPEGGIAEFMPVVDLQMGQEHYITNSIFTNNSAHVEDSMASNSTFSYGDASGGGLYVASLELSGIENSTFSGNNVQGGNSNGRAGNGRGGGLYLWSTTLQGVTVSGNSAHGGTGTANGVGQGGGIFTSGTVSILNTTISGNSAETEGGGLYASSTLEYGLAINFSTILNNTATVDAEALALYPYKVSVKNSILASSGAAPDCSIVSQYVTGTGNLRLDGDGSCSALANGTINVGLDISPTLQNNGGQTDTHALVAHANNPAWDAVASCGISEDQRGLPRDANCDVGAYELQELSVPTDTPMPPTDTPVPPTDTSVPPTDTAEPSTDTPVPHTDTLVPPTDTPGPVNLVASAVCVDENLAVTISAGDGPFNITASAGVNTPVNGVSIGTTTINGPEKWDNLTVTETSGNGESINLGQFRCRSDERPVPLVPAHRAHVTNPTPTFAWAGITDANNYRVCVFDDANPATRTVDIRQNSGGPTYLTLTTPLPNGRFFWRARGRQNRIWSLWSIRFTLFKDPPPPLSAPTPVPTIDLDAAPTIGAPDGEVPTMPAPPNSR